MNTPPRNAERSKGPARVVFDKVTKRYGTSTVAAVDQVSLDFPAGKLVTLLGPSGCGKTTTLRMIAGLEMATSGRILIGDDDVTRLPATARDVSMVFQSYALFPHMTVMENVSYGLKMSGFAKGAIVPKANEVLKQLGLDKLAARYPNELSGGQQQRVAVARAIVLEPRVLLFDEPLSNLDAKLRRYVRQEIRDLQQALGLTVVYVTHDQEEALAVSDTIVVMNNAVIAQTGTPRELHDLPQTRFVADFIGEANVLPCEVISAGGSGEPAMVRLGGLVLQTNPCEGTAGQRHVAVRPNRVSLQPAGSANTLEATVQKATYVGEQMEYIVQCALGDLFVTASDTDHPIAAGEAVALGFGVGDVVLLRD
ncbi:MAG: ABC transporter ATP-binding protein [Rhodoferax sp.]|nr:ABC transporter ATP-binding protein [Rhodoferax sp.]